MEPWIELCDVNGVRNETQSFIYARNVLHSRVTSPGLVSPFYDIWMIPWRFCWILPIWLPLLKRLAGLECSAGWAVFCLAVYWGCWVLLQATSLSPLGWIGFSQGSIPRVQKWKQQSLLIKAKAFNSTLPFSSDLTRGRPGAVQESVSLRSMITGDHFIVLPHLGY